ncbi:hypothetical protein BWQ96_07574 [Gracilariopsis chorda]|uniref:Uncharacterized protein n=1 Tax=Gracilariopsis chorda TaxID=448386 RepID=A0A2V3IKW0_9FLOR|nr:hypothetical protein BWQ96_07574 [Gracilariopsis chorda]|eukprot:PXF42688.1 hypothetical protein BWQ96_07574 [Gracilariopsis chorda]
MLAAAYHNLLGIEIGLWIVVDLKDLYGTLTTCRNAVNRSMRGDVSVIRYEFETGNIESMLWIPGRLNCADPLTTNDTPMYGSLELMLYDGKISLEFRQAIASSSNTSTG